MKIRERKRRRRELIRKVALIASCSFFAGLIIGEACYDTKQVEFVPDTREFVIKPAYKVTETVEAEPISIDIPEPKIENVVVSETKQLALSESDIDLIALITMAEAEGESELGKRLVIDVILNRIDSPRFANTAHEVIYAPGQFEVLWNGRVERCYVRDDIRQLVIEELQSRTRNDIYYFRADHYHSFGIPVLQEGNAYFSKY